MSNPLTELSQKLIEDQLNLVENSIKIFLGSPSLALFSDLCKAVDRLDFAIRIRGMVDAFDLESPAKNVVAEWKGGGGGSSGGGSSGGW